MKVYNINWDIDDIPEEELNLPTEIELPNDTDIDMVADILSDKYGFCINSLMIEE